MKILVTAILLLLSLEGFSQTYWKIRTESGEEILLTIEVSTKNQTFKAFTRKDTIKDIAGFFAYNLAHAAGKLKYPEIVYIEGQASQLKDSLKLNGTFYYTDKKYDFQATLAGNNFRGKYHDNRNRIHRLTGIQQTRPNPIRNYPVILEKIISKTETHVIHPEMIQSSEWKNFKSAVATLKHKISDDYELGALILWYNRQLPFLQVDFRRPNQPKQIAKPRLQLVKPGVAYLGNPFPEKISQRDSISEIIFRNNVKNLVVDLRGRSRISVVSAKILIDYLCNQETVSGAFLTRKWFNSHSSLPDPVQYSRLFPEIPETIEKITFLDVEGYSWGRFSGSRRFSGKLYVLTDSKTNKAAEILASILRTTKRATIVGQKTAGQRYVTESISLTPEWNLMIPVAGFYQSGNLKDEELELSPDIKVDNQDAMTYLMKSI